MSDHLIGHYSTILRISNAAQAIDATRRLEHSLHKYIITSSQRLYKAMARAASK